jgi:hypothetical protein
MNIKTVREFQNAFNLCVAIVQGQLGTNKTTAEGVPEFIPFVPQKSALAYAAKRFTEKNQEHIERIQTQINDKGYELCMTDKDTKEILYNKDGKPHQLRFTKENQIKYEKELKELFSNPIDFTVDTYICPVDKLPQEIPAELYILNGLILKHNFYEEFEPEQVSAST